MVSPARLGKLGPTQLTVLCLVRCVQRRLCWHSTRLQALDTTRRTSATRSCLSAFACVRVLVLSSPSASLGADFGYCRTSVRPATSTVSSRCASSAMFRTRPFLRGIAELMTISCRSGIRTRPSVRESTLASLPPKETST